MNKLHELYISSSNPYNDALFDKEKYDSIMAVLADALFKEAGKMRVNG